MSTAAQKAELREIIRARRKEIAPEARREYEAALETRLLNLPALKHARHIAVYSPTGSEARFASSLDKLFLLEQHPVIAFPLISSKQLMYFLSFDIADDRSILANPLDPHDEFDRDRLVDNKDIDVMLVPGIAFDRHGNRLGQGGGYYDRCLPYLREDCLTVGIAFDEQIVDEVPHEFTDCSVNYVVTPSRIISAEK